MMENYYTVEQVSEMLNIHSKTIQRYIREGKLRATKIGKGWRVGGHDLSVFVESNRNEEFASKDQPIRSTIASSVVDISANGQQEAMRIMNTLTAALNAKPAEYGPSSMQSQYIEQENMVRITLWGAVRFMAVMMDTIVSLEKQEKEE